MTHCKYNEMVSAETVLTLVSFPIKISLFGLV